MSSPSCPALTKKKKQKRKISATTSAANLAAAKPSSAGLPLPATSTDSPSSRTTTWPSFYVGIDPKLIYVKVEWKDRDEASGTYKLVWDNCNRSSHMECARMQQTAGTTSPSASWAHDHAGARAYSQTAGTATRGVRSTQPRGTHLRRATETISRTFRIMSSSTRKFQRTTARPQL
jgi:hypothetical protein